ncbi:MAG: 30S ribosomal protein S16 [Planctomycetes bacterium]|nr:30S ribosomal protein S16 [Planctomycetota bacterium]
MAVKIRLARHGRTGRPSFRIVVLNHHKRRDGAYLECIGRYDPLVKDFQKSVALDLDRLRYWQSVGAQASATVKSFARRLGFRLPAKTKAPKPARKAAARPATKSGAGSAARRKKGPGPG